MPELTSRTGAADSPAAISEEAAIACLLEHLPHADAAELLQLALTCPAAPVARHAIRVADLVEDLRAELTELVTTAYEQAQAAEAWIASMEALADAEGPVDGAAATLGVAV